MRISSLHYEDLKPDLFQAELVLNPIRPSNGNKITIGFLECACDDELTIEINGDRQENLRIGDRLYVTPRGAIEKAKAGEIAGKAGQGTPQVDIIFNGLEGSSMEGYRALFSVGVNPRWYSVSVKNCGVFVA